MLCYDRVDVLEGMDVNKTSTLIECIVCQHCYFLKKLLSRIKMGREILIFGDIEIEKHKSFHYKSPIF